MSNMRSNIAQRALPVCPVAGGVVAGACGLDGFRSPLDIARGIKPAPTASRLCHTAVAGIAATHH